MAIMKFFSVELLRSSISAQPVYTQASARSRALATTWSRAYCAITLMASNT